MHECKGCLKSYTYGSAVIECQETSEGYLLASNGEYSNEVNYCPFCGFKAKLKAREED